MLDITENEFDDALERAFAFVRSVLAPLLAPDRVEELADALVARAIEMTGE